MKSNLRQPGNTTNISDNYATHLLRGSLGGTDLTDSYGTFVHAQLDGCYVSIVDNSPDGSGGRYSRVTGPDGDSIESLHQSSVTAARGSWYDADGVIGRSGASAYGSDYGTGGPHIHNHGVHANGVRFNLEPYYWWLNGGTTTAGSNSTPIPEDDMYDDAARKELIGERIDQTMIPLLKTIVAMLGNDDAQVERILDAVRRENRPRVYQINQPGSKRHSLAAAIDVDEGYFRSYGSAAEFDNDKRLSLVAPELLQVTEAQFDDLQRRATERLAAITAK